MLPRVFGMFAQSRRALGHSQGGLGIGLKLVRSFVEMHGGTVQVFSEGPGRGSEFIVCLPVIAPAVWPETLTDAVPATFDRTALSANDSTSPKRRTDSCNDSTPTSEVNC